MLTWDNLTKSYGRRRLFSGLSGELDLGSGLVVLGANGAGKSTLLKILAGLARPDGGQVVRPDDRNEIGYSAPHLSLYGELTGLENLRFYGALRGVSDAAEPMDLLERLGLRRAADRPVSIYSTGMVQRLRIACALAHRPAILILDEPTIGLDRDGVALVEQVVAEHVSGREPGAAIVATNDTEQFERFAEAGWPSITVGS